MVLGGGQAIRVARWLRRSAPPNKKPDPQRRPQPGGLLHNRPNDSLRSKDPTVGTPNSKFDGNRKWHLGRRQSQEPRYRDRRRRLLRLFSHPRVVNKTGILSGRAAFLSPFCLVPSREIETVLLLF